MIKKLLNLKLKFTKNQKGLTLIELLVVIVILGIIAAIAIPAVMSQTEKATDNALKQTESVVKDAVQRYRAVEGEWPATVSALSDATGDKYLDSEPLCPNGTENEGTNQFSVDSTTGVVTNQCKTDLTEL